MIERLYKHRDELKDYDGFFADFNEIFNKRGKTDIQDVIEITGAYLVQALMDMVDAHKDSEDEVIAYTNSGLRFMRDLSVLLLTHGEQYI